MNRSASQKALLIVTLLSLIGMVGCSKTPEEKRDRLYAEAMELVDEYRFDEADSTLVRVLRADTLSWLGPEGMAIVQNRQWMFWDALNYYMRIMERNARSQFAYDGAARVCRWLGYHDKAYEYRSRAGNLAGEDGVSLSRFARICLESGRLPSAERIATSLTKHGQSPSMVAVLMARIYLYGPQANRALPNYDLAMAGGEESSLFYQYAADYLEDAGMLDSAITISRKSLETARDSGWGEHEALVEHFTRSCRLGYFREARQLIDELPPEAEGTTSEAVMLFTYNLAARRSYEVGNSAARILNTRDVGVSPFIYDMEACNFRNDDGSLMADRETIHIKLRQGYYAAEFRNLLDYHMVIMQANAVRDFVKGARDLQYFAKFDFDPVEFDMARLRVHRIGQFEPDVTVLLDSIRLAHDGEEVWQIALADLAADTLIGEYEVAKEIYIDMLKKRPHSYPAFKGLVEMYANIRQWDRAVQLFEIYPYMTGLYKDLGVLKARVMVGAGSIDAGVNEFIESIAPLSGQIDRYKELILTLRKPEQAPLRQGIIDRMLELQPDNPDALLIAASEYIDREEWGRARELIDRGLTLEPDNYDFQASLARVMVKSGESEEGFEMFEEVAQKTYEDNAKLLRYYSISLAEEERDGARAQNLARRGVFADLMDIRGGFENLCHIYFVFDRADLVIGEARRASKTYRYTPELHYYLGYSLYLTGKDGARESLEKALELGLEGEKLERAQEALQELQG